MSSLLFLRSQVLPFDSMFITKTVLKLSCPLSTAQQFLNSFYFGHLKFLTKTMLDWEHHSLSFCASIPIILHINYFFDFTEIIVNNC